jgi:hypothetical protein
MVTKEINRRSVTRAVLILLLGIGCIFSPFVWMKIGPGGYITYGPDVPDIWIYGGWITGKDRSWLPIGMSWKFQLITMLIFVGMSMLYLFHAAVQIRKGIRIFQLILLLFFPFWLFLYSGHVVNNSDGADLTVYWQAGCLVFLVLLMLIIRDLTTLLRKSKNSQ